MSAQFYDPSMLGSQSIAQQLALLAPQQSSLPAMNLGSNATPFMPTQFGQGGLGPSAGSDWNFGQGGGAVPGAAAGQGFWNWDANRGVGSNIMNNLPAISSGIQGLGSLYGIYNGMKSMSLAKDNFNFQKTAYQTNLRNSTQSYNTALEDRIRGRTSDYAGKEADVAAYLSKNSLKGG